MELFVTDRHSIEDGYLVRSSYAVISVTDPRSRQARIPKTPGCRGILRLRFHDAIPRPGEPAEPPLRYAAAKDADAVRRFVDEHKGSVGAFVLHCNAGMSRSPAVAAALAEYLGEDPEPFWQSAAPNLHVHEVMKAGLSRS